MDQQENVNPALLSVTKPLMVLLDKTYDRASNHINLLMVVGYAGVFSLWNLTEKFLDKSLALVVGILISISLLIFMGWEFYKMLTSSNSILGMSKLVLNNTNPEKFVQDAGEISSNSRDQLKMILTLWPIVICSAGITGFGAMIILLGTYIGASVSH